MMEHVGANSTGCMALCCGQNCGTAEHAACGDGCFGMLSVYGTLGSFVNGDKNSGTGCLGNCYHNWDNTAGYCYNGCSEALQVCTPGSYCTHAPAGCLSDPFSCVSSNRTLCSGNGYYCPDNSTAPVPCPVNTYVGARHIGAPGISSCIGCAAGMWTAGKTAQTVCVAAPSPTPPAPKSGKYSLIDGDNFCYETIYTDDNYMKKGWKSGACAAMFNKVVSTSHETICKGHSEENIKYCPTSKVTILVTKKGVGAALRAQVA